jgi:aryl-alcohol dehydrogenase-like predicted oxidoreductase
LVELINQIAAEKGCSASQLSLAWVLVQGDDIVPIPGTKRRKYLEENVGALEVRLTRQDVDRINEVMPMGVAAGTRYPESVMRMLGR